MRLREARVKKYRSIRDTGWFDIESGKTILVGANEAGKTVLLQALQQINPPEAVRNFDPLRDYPRSEYNDITTGKITPKDITVVEAKFILDKEDYEFLPDSFKDSIYVFGRKLDNKYWHEIIGGPEIVTYSEIKKDLNRLICHIKSRIPKVESSKDKIDIIEQCKSIISEWKDEEELVDQKANQLSDWLESILQYVDESNSTEENRYERLFNTVKVDDIRKNALKTLKKRMPIFVLFNNYFRVKPTIHLAHLAKRIETNILDDDEYDYGNKCLLQLLGFSPKQLSDLGNAKEPAEGDVVALQNYKDQLDSRSYQLNAASVKLTEEISKVWLPIKKKGEADRLRVQADGQYLKVVVEDDLGVEIELHQRSEGYQWLVSFFVVFFAEASDQYQNAILLLDEPGLSLHGLKQREFRKTISRLSISNQTLYTTHSPFLVGPDELDLVRVIEMTDRKIGTKVHTTITAEDPASMLPLQEALGYDMAQSLFAHQRNLILEGLTDYWYLEATSQLLREDKIINLNEKISLIPAKSASKVVYFATILHSQKLKVAALLDSDNAGKQVAKLETLIHTLGNKNILRTKDSYTGPVTKPEIEDLLRDTLIKIAKDDLGWDIEECSKKQPSRPIVSIFSEQIKDFSKYKLSKSYIRWTRDHTSKDLLKKEKENWYNLIKSINQAIK